MTKNYSFTCLAIDEAGGWYFDTHDFTLVPDMPTEKDLRELSSEKHPGLKDFAVLGMIQFDTIQQKQRFFGENSG